MSAMVSLTRMHSGYDKFMTLLITMDKIRRNTFTTIYIGGGGDCVNLRNIFSSSSFGRFRQTIISGGLNCNGEDPVETSLREQKVLFSL